MESLIWRKIRGSQSKPSRILIIFSLILVSISFSLPRIGEGWFEFTAIAYPIIILIALELSRRFTPYLGKIKEHSLALLSQKQDQSKLAEWWENLNYMNYFLWCMIVGLLLAIFSLLISQNKDWSRYSDALGVLFVGFFLGEVSFRIFFVPIGISRLKKYVVKLNPINPANSPALHTLADTTLSLGLGMGLSLLALNLIAATSSVIFTHLFPGILVISLLAWIIIIGLTIYPHTIFWQLAKKKKLEALQAIDQKLEIAYKKALLDENQDNEIEDLIKLYQHIQQGKTSLANMNQVAGIIFTLFINTFPVIISYLLQR